jgi:IS605 OrfB family transposase
MSGKAELRKTVRLKVKPEAYAWLNRAAVEVNQVWNWANEVSGKAIARFAGAPRFLTGYDLGGLSAGSSQFFDCIGSDTIQGVCQEYAVKRRVARRTQLRWRRSFGSHRSLGWVPFKGACIKRKGNAVRFYSKTFRLFDVGALDGMALKGGCFAQDAVGDWWFCVSVATAVEEAKPAARPIVGVDLGLKDIATTSDGDRLGAGRFFRDAEARIAQAQRRGHKRQAKRLHRKAARQREDALHKFSRKLVDRYEVIVVGDVSSPRMAGMGRMGKAVHDSGWGILRTQLLYKGQQAGRRVEIVNERNTTRACSGCGSLTGPAGRTGLAVRAWCCSACGAEHDRDVNAARNIATLGSRLMTSVSGNELTPCGRWHDSRQAAHVAHSHKEASR